MFSKIEPDEEGPLSACNEWGDLCTTKVLLAILLWGRGLIISGHNLGVVAITAAPSPWGNSGVKKRGTRRT